MIRIGVDVGGTNTDAVVMDGTAVLGSAKVTTTPDVLTGLATALGRALDASGARPADVRAVMVGTTHFTNALVERRGLARTAVLRIGLPATTSVPPFADWPPDLVSAIGGIAMLAHGGSEFDGDDIAPLDPAELERIAGDLRTAGVRAVAIVGVFSPVADTHERRAAEVVRAALPGVAISLSHEVGRLGLLERENATALNACLSDLAASVIGGIRDAVTRIVPGVRLYLTQNDGTLIAADVAMRYPVRTIASGPTNSMRGAAFLSGLRDGIVVDIGGTTTDVGVIVRGFPREAGASVRVAGVRTNFRMPDVLSLGLGGGSIVDGPSRIGPRSVGASLARDARVFGGGTLTATDVAVAAGRAQVGDVRAVGGLDPALVQGAAATIDATLAEAIDRMKTTAGAVPVVLVGGGAILAADALPGASRTLRPRHHAIANAIGAAIAEVSGETDRVFSLTQLTREDALRAARAEAAGRAVASGADPSRVEIVEVEEVPLTYLPSSAVRIRVKAVGGLADG